MWHIKSRYYVLKIALFSHSILPPKHPEQTGVRVDLDLLQLPLQCRSLEGVQEKHRLFNDKGAAAGKPPIDPPLLLWAARGDGGVDPRNPRRVLRGDGSTNLRDLGQWRI